MPRRTKSRWLFAVGLLLGFTGGVGAISLLCYGHRGRPPWGLQVPEHPKRAAYRRLGEARDRFYAEVGRPPAAYAENSPTSP